jgi:hypothetical protein
MASNFLMPPTMHTLKGSLCTYEVFDEVLGINHEGIYCQQLVDEQNE